MRLQRFLKTTENKKDKDTVYWTEETLKLLLLLLTFFFSRS